MANILGAQGMGNAGPDGGGCISLISYVVGESALTPQGVGEEEAWSGCISLISYIAGIEATATE